MIPPSLLPSFPPLTKLADRDETTKMAAAAAVSDLAGAARVAVAIIVSSRLSAVCLPSVVSVIISSHPQGRRRRSAPSRCHFLKGTLPKKEKIGREGPCLSDVCKISGVLDPSSLSLSQSRNLPFFCLLLG